MPATTTIAVARCSAGSSPSSRCSPATPTSVRRSAGQSIIAAVSAASSATAASAVPALQISTPRAVGRGATSGDRQVRQRARSW